ncbi:hypothetical protein ACTHAM_001717 [Cellulomonas soli]|uniref:hypothetical protein n=1 Tax=Cellulomonas soli TaxID=931535 RepID=UPI003F854A96
MHPELILIVHRQAEATLERELAHRRAAEACPGCVVHPQRWARTRARADQARARIVAGVGGRIAPRDACCAA